VRRCRHSPHHLCLTFRYAFRPPLLSTPCPSCWRMHPNLRRLPAGNDSWTGGSPTNGSAGVNGAVEGPLRTLAAAALVARTRYGPGVNKTVSVAAGTYTLSSTLSLNGANNNTLFIAEVWSPPPPFGFMAIRENIDKGFQLITIVCLIGCVKPYDWADHIQPSVCVDTGLKGGQDGHQRRAVHPGQRLQGTEHVDRPGRAHPSRSAEPGEAGQPHPAEPHQSPAGRDLHRPGRHGALLQGRGAPRRPVAQLPQLRPHRQHLQCWCVCACVSCVCGTC
jgi:hypothetical protein